jgi:hypothetical protein
VKFSSKQINYASYVASQLPRCQLHQHVFAQLLRAKDKKGASCDINTVSRAATNVKA